MSCGINVTALNMARIKPFTSKSTTDLSNGCRQNMILSLSTVPNFVVKIVPTMVKIRGKSHIILETVW